MAPLEYVRFKGDLLASNWIFNRITATVLLTGKNIIASKKSFKGIFVGIKSIVQLVEQEAKAKDGNVHRAELNIRL